LREGVVSLGEVIADVGYGTGDMGKRILVAIDGSPASMVAVEYIGAFFAKKTGVKIDLIHVLSEIPPLFLEPGESMDEMLQLQGFSENVLRENRCRAASMMEEASAILAGAGMDSANTRTLIEERSSGVARDILRLEQEGAYDAIVLGRHGVGVVEEFFMGSITNKVLHHAKGLPLCVVHGKNEARKLLITVDMSPNSKRVLDLAGWLVAEAGPTEVTILYVLAPLIAKEMASLWTGLTEMEATIERRLVDDAEEMLSQAETYLIELGVPSFAIKSHLETGTTDVTGAILQKAREGGYGSVIVGRRGISRTKRFLFGSVSNKIVQQARDMAVWVVC